MARRGATKHTPPVMTAPTERWPTTFLLDDERHEMPDPLAVEEPLEIRLAGASGDHAPLAVTLRTPGADRELVAGLLYAEGIVDRREEILSLEPLPGVAASGSRLLARLAAPPAAGAATARPFLSTSACGACGKGALEAVLAEGFPPLPPGPHVDVTRLQSLPDRMRAAQTLFAETGGLHAAALFSPRGELLLLREDIGRHNAVDKVVGALLLAGALPAGEAILVVSGRAGFEVVQKALRAGVPVLAAVGAPSSLAARLASRAGMTLAGFVRPGRCNVYTGTGRIDLVAHRATRGRPAPGGAAGGL
jgi:FdhD protein